MNKDPVKITQDLINCPSVTPQEGGALDLLESLLKSLGFTCHRLLFEEVGTDPVHNLFAIRGQGPGGICFAGHTDVVPAGDIGAWGHNPFNATIREGYLYGRGAVDMKGGIGAFVAAVARLLESDPSYSSPISFLITGDEEGPAINGTQKVLAWMKQQNLIPDFCIVGEPTCREVLGDTIKIGRRGTMTGYLTVLGTQGHVAYPHRADNPIPRLLETLQHLNKGPQENASTFFDPSNLEITTVDVGNPASNIIPSKGQAVFNIRFSDQQTAQSLTHWIKGVCEAHAGQYKLELECGGDSFLQQPNPWMHEIAAIVQDVTGVKPDLNTVGGTSDARFIYKFCPVLEFGPMGRTMHKVDECVSLQDLEALTQVYEKILRAWLKKGK